MYKKKASPLPQKPHALMAVTFGGILKGLYTPALRAVSDLHASQKA